MQAVYPSNYQVRFAVVGYGRIGRRHAAMIEQHTEAKLISIADTQPEARKLSNVPAYDSLTTLLLSEHKPDIVNICTPNGTHAMLAIEALKAGCHVVIEKPMALSRADCEEIIFTSIQCGRLVFCVMQNRYSPPSRWLYDVVQSGILGDIYLLQMNCFWNRDQRYYTQGGWHGSQTLDGGTLFTQFSHFIDTLFWVFGDITRVQARLYDFNHQQLTDFEDSGTVMFDLVKGGKGSFNFSTAAYDQNLESSLTVLARNGTLKVGGQYMERVEYCHIKNYEMPALEAAAPANDYGGYKGSAANHHFVIANVIDSLKGRSVAATNALEGLKVVEIIEKIYNSGK